MKTSHNLTCPDCQTTGKIIATENDQPFSAPWENYTVEGVNGKPYYVEPWASWDQVFQNVSPTCPQCAHAFTLGDMLGIG